MLKTLNTLINMKEVTNQLKWGVTQGVIAKHGLSLVHGDRVMLEYLNNFCLVSSYCTPDANINNKFKMDNDAYTECIMYT